MFTNQNRHQICAHVSIICSKYSSIFSLFLILSTFILLQLTRECEHFDIMCRAEPGTANLDSALREIYVLYAECALVRRT